MKKALLTFSTEHFLGKSFGKRVLVGRFRWLLSELCKNAGIDVGEIDESLEYWEAKREIQKQFLVKAT